MVPRSCDFNGMGCQQTNDLKETNNGLIRYNFSRNININGIMITYDITEASTTNQLSLGISSSSLMYTTRTISLSMARDLDVNVTYADVSWVVMNISFIGANLVFSVSFNCGKFTLSHLPAILSAVVIIFSITIANIIS